jgi:hypothetical protein
MPGGKPAGVRCRHLTADHCCGIYESPERPPVCASFQATEEFCGTDRDEGLRLLADLEARTRADG